MCTHMIMNMHLMGILYQANRDPRRIHWLLELLMTNPLHGDNGSFMDARCVYAVYQWWSLGFCWGWLWSSSLLQSDLLIQELKIEFNCIYKIFIFSYKEVHCSSMYSVHSM